MKTTNENKTKTVKLPKGGHKKIKLYSWQNEEEYEKLRKNDVGFRLTKEQYQSI
jgi:GH25 family lysozyme M1 (1,4-beta-N-acetylmuramidase)